MFSWRKNKKLLIQNVHTMPVFIDMLRLTMQRHAAYCVSHNFDYWCMFGNPCPERETGAWDKIDRIMDGLRAGYEFVAWVDTDAAIMGDEDLSNALTADQHIGGCIHDAHDIPRHINVGALYFNNTKETRLFVSNWHDSYPATEHQWQEQGEFNRLAKEHPEIVSEIDAKWNSTVDTNEVDNPVVKGWHGIRPHSLRLQVMKKELQNDFLKYRV